MLKIALIGYGKMGKTIEKVATDSGHTVVATIDNSAFSTSQLNDADVAIEFTQPDITVEGNPDGKGYEWYTDGQETSWYRNEGSNLEWQRFEA